MAIGIGEVVHSTASGIGERAKDVYRKATRLSHDARGLTALAQDTIDSGREAAYDAVRSVKRQTRQLEHLPEDVAYHVRREPFWWLGSALTTGFVVGAVVGWAAAGTKRR
jgi:hypothetical protein